MRTPCIYLVYEDGKIIPVELEVKEFINNNGGLYLTVALSKIEESEVVEEPRLSNAEEVSPLFSDSTISLQRLFKNVNTHDGRFLKYTIPASRLPSIRPIRMPVGHPSGYLPQMLCAHAQYRV